MALLRTPSGQPPAQNPSPLKTNKLVVCIKAYNNRHYVVSESNKKTVNANCPHCKAWERHTIIDLNGGRLQHGDRVAVRTHWKRYWSAQPNGRLEANRTKLLGWEKFTIRKRSGPGGGVITYRNKITLQGAHGKYVVAENAGSRDVKANRGKAKEWETFTLIKP